MRKPNELKKKLKQGEVVLGPWCVLPSPDVINVIAASGMDFVILDMEHGGISLDTLGNMIRAAEGEKCCPLVRVGQRDELQILTVLDLGSHGVIVPHVSKKCDAEEVVSYVKYHPKGIRGFSPFTRAGGYGLLGLTDHAAKENEETLTAIILEGMEGINNLDEILDTISLDLIYIGAYDLSQALGMPGQVNHKEVRTILEKCVRKIRDRGIATGGHVAKNAEDIRWMKDMGMQFITCLPDVTMVFHAFHGLVEDFKELR